MTWCTRFGALGIIIGCPAIAYILYFACNENGCPSSSFLSAPLQTLAAQWPGFSGIFSVHVFVYYCFWYSGLALLQFVLPGKKQYGVELRDKTRLLYKLNGSDPCTPLTPDIPDGAQCWKRSQCYSSIWAS